MYATSVFSVNGTLSDIFYRFLLPLLVFFTNKPLRTNASHHTKAFRMSSQADSFLH
jgi:hypothetical protein